jgi:predicted nucleic acid-binding protein
VIVLDASAAIEWLLQTAVGARVEERIFSHATTLHAPDLIDIEVVQVLRRYFTAGMITASRGQEALDARLVTCDGKIASAPGHRARVEVV